MDCKDVQARLLDYADHTLDAATREEVEQHLATCERCRLELDETVRLLRTMEKTVLEQPGPALRENFQLMLQSELNLQATAGILKERADEGEGYDDARDNRDDRYNADKQDKRDERTGKTGDDGSGGAGRILGLSTGSPVWKVAAALILLLGGIGIGTRLKPAPARAAPDQMAALQKEVKEMKEVVLFSLLDDESASQRLKAVSYAEGMSNPDQQVISALVGTLNHDKNVNVRLASLYSLARFADNPAVRDSLISSLKGQTEPLIQVSLINILADKKETRAIGPIRDILSRDTTLKEVKDAAQKGLKTL